MDITQLQKHTGFLRIIDSPIKMSGTFYVTTEADKVIESMSEVNRIAALEISTLQAENAELAKLLTEGCNGFGSVLIQTSDMAGVNDWRKRVKEYLLITNHRSE